MVKYLGLERLSASVGFLQMAKGPAALVGPPLAGKITFCLKLLETRIEILNHALSFRSYIKSNSYRLVYSSDDIVSIQV